MSAKILNQVLKQIRASKAPMDPSATDEALIAAVFDLDSTLFDVSPRTKRILHDFSADPLIRQQFPDLTQALLLAELHRSDWGVEDILARTKLTQSQNFLIALKQFWQERFFTNEYLHFDTPYPGATDFVNELWQDSVNIIYLTGRDSIRMGEGTIEVLKKWNFPLEKERANLVLKPHKNLDDAKFKSDWFASKEAKTFEKIWFFENEPVNIDLVRKNHPKVEIIYFDSTHSRKATPPTDLPTILHFLRED